MRLALFDCDGTLVDSGRLIHEVMARTFEHHGYERPHYDATKSIIGLTLDTAIARIMGVEIDDHVQAMTRHYKEIYGPVRQEPGFQEPLYDGVAEMIRTLAMRDDVLVGAVSPSGRLPFSIPVSEKQLPLFEPRAPRVDYDLWHGYRKLLRQGEKAAYPFGFGLSYSSFERSDPQARLNTPEQAEGAGQACVELAVAVANHGAMAAADVVQVYLEPPGLLMERPNRVLVAFQRVWLEPGERQRLTLTIPLRRLACFDEQRDRFVVEKGLHRLVVAAHADDPGVAANLDLEERELGG